MAFTQVAFDSDDLTCDFGRKEQLDLFDTKCITAIHRDTANVPKRARTDPESVIAASSPSYLAIATESIINLFTVTGEIGYVCSTEIPDGEWIIAMKWLADTGLLVIASNKAKLCIFSVSTKSFVLQMALSGEWESCILDDFYNDRVDSRALFVAPNTGLVYRVVFDSWQSSIMRALADSDALLTSLLQTASGRVAQLEMDGAATFQQMVALSYSSAGGCCTDGSFRLVRQQLKNGPLQIVMNRRDLVAPFIRARLICDDSLLAVLTKEGYVKIIDMAVQCEIDSFVIPRSSTETIVDFAFLEWPKTHDELKKIALIVDKEGGKTEIQIRSLDTQMDTLGAVSYSREVVRGAVLLQLSGAPPAGSEGEETERLAFIIEPPCAQQTYAEQSVRVRDVVETQPEQRLLRLINRGMLDEAERFAVDNNLDVQSVYSSRVALLLQQLSESPDDEKTFNAFLMAVRKLDKESKGEWVLGAIAPLRNAHLISRLLEYAEKEGVAELDSIAYNFATYRMVFGPNAEYGTVWGEYQASADWVTQWVKLIKIGEVAAARIIWQRYPREMKHEMNEGLVVDVIHAAEESMRMFPDQWQFTIDHLETDVMPMAVEVSQDSTLVYTPFIELIVLVATQLEKVKPQGFPDNALYAVSAVERLVNRLKRSALTPFKSAEFITSCSRNVEKIEEMYKRSRDLRAIKRLKETYECPLSYARYMKLSTKEMCHEILQRSVQNPATVIDRIERIARPFMEEHSLPVDETLLGHVEKVTSIARCQTSSEPLDVHCLLVAEAINSVAVRARAVLLIANSAAIPWCAKLSESVRRVMEDHKIEQAIKDELNVSSDRMRLGAICQDYGLNREYVDTAIDTYSDFSAFIRFLLTGSLTSTREITDEGRYDIAAEAVSIYDRLRPGVRPSYESPRVDVREYVNLLVYKKELSALHKFVEREGVIEQTIEMLVTIEESMNYAFEGDKEWQIRRESSIEAINSLIQRHRREDMRWKETREDMRKMLTLVTKYAFDVPLIVLRQSGMRASLLHRFMKRTGSKLKECVELATVLGMSHDETFLALLDYSLPSCPRTQKIIVEDVDIVSVLYLSKKAVLNARCASSQLLKKVIQVAELMMNKMIPRGDSMSEEECETADVHTQELDDILPAVIELDTELMVTERALAIHRAVRFIRETVRQMQQTQQGAGGVEGTEATMFTMNNSRRNSVDEDEVDERSVDALTHPHITTNFPVLRLSNRRRVGAYDASMENPIDEKTETMKHVCGVIFMMDERPDPTKGGAEAEKRLEQMEEKWVELLSHLNLNSQYMLEMHARVLYAVWGGRSEGSEVLSSLCEGPLAERLVQQHPCDLPLLATLFATLDEQTCMQCVTRLMKRFGSSKSKAPQTMLNLCRLAQLMLTRRDRAMIIQQRSTSEGGGNETPAQRTSAAPDMSKLKNVIRDQYMKAMWEKRLGKRRIVAHTDGAKAVREFASHMLQPEIVREYLLGVPPSKLPWEGRAVSQLTSDRHEALILVGMADYLKELINNAVKAKEDDERDGFLVTADNTIDMLLEQTVYEERALREYLTELLVVYLERDCCPYAYEVIQFVLSKLILLGGVDDVRWKMGKKVADFITISPRSFPVSDAEKAWYTERRTDKNMETGTMGEMDSHNFVPMPDKASSRLPLHLFLRTSEVDVAKYVVPVVWHEITLSNMQDWYNLLREVYTLSTIRDIKSEKMKLKRQVLITKAVMKYIKAAQEQNDQLSESNMEWIQERLYAEKNVNHLLNTFFLEMIQFAPQGNTRIQLTQLGYNVTKKYLREQPENAPDRAKIQEQQERLQMSLREMNTKRLLVAHKIFNQDTSPFVKDVDTLIARIYDRFINWDEPTDVQQKCALIQELAETNEHNLEETHERIVGAWLCGEKGSGEGDETVADVDMNDTMGSLGDFGGTDTANKDDDDWIPIPFYDEEVTRIVHVVRLSKRKQRLVQSLLLNYVNMTKPPGGHSTHIRALSTLLRACTAQELVEWAPLSNEDYGNALDRRLNRRLVERSLGVTALSQFDKCVDSDSNDKLTLFIRNLITGTQRNRPGTLWLAATLTIDLFNEDDGKPIVDQKLIDHMLAKLYQEKKYNLLTTFLKFCSSTSCFRTTRNINVPWGRTIESVMKELEDESTPVSTIHEWLLFALACPAPGKAALESLKRLLEKRGATVGAYLVRLATSYTETHEAPCAESWLHPERVDYPVKWKREKEEEEGRDADEGEEEEGDENAMDTTSY